MAREGMECWPKPMAETDGKRGDGMLAETDGRNQWRERGWHVGRNRWRERGWHVSRNRWLERGWHVGRDQHIHVRQPTVLRLENWQASRHTSSSSQQGKGASGKIPSKQAASVRPGTCRVQPASGPTRPTCERTNREYSLPPALPGQRVSAPTVSAPCLRPHQADVKHQA